MGKTGLESKKIKFIMLMVCIFLVGTVTAVCVAKPQKQWVTNQYGTTSDDTVELTADTEIKIMFTIQEDNFQGIAIRFANQGKYDNETLNCVMYDEETGEQLAEYETQMCSEIYNSGTFLKLPCQNSKNRRVSVVFSGKNLAKSILFCISNNQGEKSRLYVDDELQESVLVFSGYFLHSVQYNIKVIPEGLLIIILLVFVYVWNISNIRLMGTEEAAYSGKIRQKAAAYYRHYKKTVGFILLLFFYACLSIFVYQSYVDEAVKDKYEADILKPQGNAETLTLSAGTKEFSQVFRLKEQGLSKIVYRIKVKQCSAQAKLQISVYHEKRNTLLSKKVVLLKDAAQSGEGILEIALDREFEQSKRKNIRVVLIPMDFGDSEMEFLTSHKIKIAECVVDGVSQKVTPAVRVIYRDRDFLRPLYLVFSILLLIFLCVIYYVLVFAKRRREAVFIPVAMLLGLLYLFAIPVYTVPDEYTHIDTAYEISNRIMGIEASGKPGYMYKRACDIETDMASVSKASIDSYRRVYTSLFEKAADTALTECYGKNAVANAGIIYYLPAAVGMTIARLLNWGTFPMFMFGRFCNLLAYVLLAYLALRKMPWGKNVLCVMMTLSITLQEAASFSYDGIINGFAFVYLAYCFSFMDKSKDIRKRDAFVFLFLLMQMASVKGGVYLPLCFLVFLIPYERDWKVKGNIRYYVGITLFILLAFTKNNIAAVMTRLNSPQGTAINGFTGKELYTFGYLFHHPLKFISLYVNTLLVEGDDYVQGVLGGELGMHQLYMPWICLFVVVFVLYFLCRDKENRMILQKSFSRLWIGLMAFGSAVLVCLSMLVSFTTMEYNFIEGVQGRYFIPILLLPCVILGSRKRTKLAVNENTCLMVYYGNHMVMLFYIIMDVFLS